MDIASFGKDVWSLIIRYLSEKDIVALCLTSKTVHDHLFERFLHPLFHDCFTEMEKEWNSRVEDISRRCRSKAKSHCLTVHEDESWDFECSIFSWKTHYLSLAYHHNPMDVDILEWFLNA